MAETYWIGFRIGQGGDAEERYQEVLAEVRRLTSDYWWTEVSNFIAFHSEHGLENIATQILAKIDPKQDMALISKTDTAEAIVVGTPEDSMLYEVMPYVSRLHL